MEVSEIRRLINAELGESPSRDLEDRQDASMGNCEGNVELAETNSTSAFCENSPVSSC